MYFKRGFKSKETAKINIDGMKIYHNFIKEQEGKTPSQRANIDLKLKGNKWLTLLQQSLKES